MQHEKVGSYLDALEYMRGLRSKSEILLYRGQCSANWKLEPSFYRVKCIQGSDLSLSERNVIYDNLIKTFKKSMIQYGFNPMHSNIVVDHNTENIEYEAIAQHYGLPTKLLDFTYSPYVALFFAFDGNGINEIGARDSDYVSIYIMDYKKYIEQICHSEAGAEEEIAIQALRKKGRYVVKIDIDNSPELRLRRQQGTFLYAEYAKEDNSIEDLFEKRELSNCLYKIDIPFQDQVNAINELKFMGITPAYLSASLDGVSKSIINDLLRFKK